MSNAPLAEATGRRSREIDARQFELPNGNFPWHQRYAVLALTPLDFCPRSQAPPPAAGQGWGVMALQ